MVGPAHHPDFTCDGIEEALDMLDLRSTKVVALEYRMLSLKTQIAANGGGILSATEQLLNLFEASLRGYVLRIQPASGDVADSFFEAKRKLKVQLRMLRYMAQYDNKGKGSFSAFMSRKPRDFLDSNKSEDSGRGTSNEEQNEVLENSSPAKLVGAETSPDPVDQLAVNYHISRIRQSVPCDQHSSYLQIVLQRLETFVVAFLQDAAYYVEVPDELNSRMETLSLRVDSLLEDEYQRVLTLLGQWNVVGVISFLESEIFPQHSTYVTLLDNAVRQLCEDKSVTEAEMTPDELRRLKWRAAAEDVSGNNILTRLKKGNRTLNRWTEEDVANNVTQLASVAGKRSWVGFDGQPTMGDEVMAAELDWIINDHPWKGYGSILMEAACGLVPVTFQHEVNFSWFDTPLVKKCTDELFQLGKHSYDHYSQMLAACLKTTVESVLVV